jgi:hypothetical protein
MADEIADLIAQLTQLQVQQTDLLTRLQQATDNQVPSVVHPRRTPQFEIGDKVSIRNPNPYLPNQPQHGTVTKIGLTRITVTSPSGQKIQRAPKNLILVRVVNSLRPP